MTGTDAAPTSDDAGAAPWAWPALGVCVAVLVGLTMANPWPFGSDDSIFYVVIARNIVGGHGVTFNEIMPTNGVQPLWQVVVTAVVGVLRLVGVDGPVATLRTLYAVNWVFVGLALVHLYRLLADVEVPAPLRKVGVVVLGLVLCGPWAMFGSEGHMAALLVVALLRALVRVVTDDADDGPSLRRTALLGVLGGLMCLSRLDSVWFVLTVFVVALVPLAGRPTLARTLRVATGGVATVVVLAPYLVWNLVEFGHLMPVSGVLKVDTSSPGFDLAAAGTTSVALVGLVWIAGSLAVMTRTSPPLLRRAWLAAAVGATASTGWYVVFSKGGYTQFNWYLMVHAVALSLTAVMMAVAVARLGADRDALARLVHLVVPLGCIALGVAAVAYSYLNISEGSPDRTWIDLRAFTTEVAETVPAGDRIATVDFPGVLGLLAEDQRILALDGLTGDFDFQEDLRDRGISCVLAQHDVRWLVTEDAVPATPDAGGRTATLWYNSWQFRETESTVTVDLADDQGLTPGRRGYHLWRVRPAC